MAFMFKTMKHCSKDYEIRHVNSTSVLQYQHKWELDQKKIDKAEAPRDDKNDWANTMDNIVLHLKLMRGTRGGTCLCSLVPCQGVPYLAWIWCLSEP